MPGKPVFTATWECNETRFLSRHGFKGQVTAALGALMDVVVNNQPWFMDKVSAHFTIETKLPGVEYGLLTCICAVNEQTGDYAPAALYFPGAKRTENMSDIAKALADVRAELGW